MPLVKLTAAGVEPVSTIWTRLSDGDAVPAAGAVLVPLALWLADRAALLARADAVGVWLAPGQAPDALAEDFDRLPVIALDFPVFGDGRAYSVARLLRERFGYRGELRAIGDVLIDQIHHMVRTGFDGLDVRRPVNGAEVTVQAVEAALNRYSLAYQVAYDARPPVSALRRRQLARGA